MQPTNRSLWLMAVSSILFLGAALVTLRAAEVASSAQGGRATAPSSRTSAAEPAQPAAAIEPERPAPSAPEESATIFDDPTAVPDARQSADHDVSFPADI